MQPHAVMIQPRCSTSPHCSRNATHSACPLLAASMSGVCPAQFGWLALRARRSAPALLLLPCCLTSTDAASFRSVASCPPLAAACQLILCSIADRITVVLLYVGEAQTVFGRPDTASPPSFPSVPDCALPMAENINAC